MQYNDLGFFWVFFSLQSALYLPRSVLVEETDEDRNSDQDQQKSHKR